MGRLKIENTSGFIFPGDFTDDLNQEKKQCNVSSLQPPIHLHYLALDNKKYCFRHLEDYIEIKSLSFYNNNDNDCTLP